ncbi:MAG: MarR family transcriptional regulator [Chloroflexota bacterium]
MPDTMKTQAETQPLATNILALMAQVAHKFEPGKNEMSEWMLANFPTPQIVEILQEATPVMLRVVDAIGQLEPVNGITIAEHHHIPKGTVSKTTRKLIAQNLITSESLPNNKKEILFRLTPLGSELFHAHRAFDQQMERGFYTFIERYNPDEMQFLARVLQDVIDTSFLELGSTSAKG